MNENQNTSLDPEYKAYQQNVNQGRLDKFKSVPYAKRTLFLSHCIRKDLKAEIKEYAEKLGYAVHVVGGGSIVHKIISRENPQAVVGVACHLELEMAVDRLDIPLQVVELETDGCKNTLVNVEAAKQVLAVYEPAKNK